MSILEKFSSEEGQVFDLEISTDNKSVNFIETINYHFNVELNKKEFGKLIHELTMIHRDMENEP